MVKGDKKLAKIRLYPCRYGVGGTRLRPTYTGTILRTTHYHATICTSIEQPRQGPQPLEPAAAIAQPAATAPSPSPPGTWANNLGGVLHA